MKEENQKSPFKIQNLDEDAGFLLLQLSSLWERRHDKILKHRYDITATQYAVMASIYWLSLNRDREVTQVLLAKHTQMDPMTISQMFKVLERRGYIYRQCHSEDVRAKAVFLTEPGKELMDRAVATIIEVDARFFNVLGKNLQRFNRGMLTLIREND